MMKKGNLNLELILSLKTTTKEGLDRSCKSPSIKALLLLPFGMEKEINLKRGIKIMSLKHLM